MLKSLISSFLLQETWELSASSLALSDNMEGATSEPNLAEMIAINSSETASNWEDVTMQGQTRLPGASDTHMAVVERLPR